MVKAALTQIVGLIIGLLLALPVAAQQQGADGAGKAPRPLWSELSPKQQAVLAPLAADWESLDTTRRKKWVTIANRYPKMKPDEQQRLQSRMQAWAKLTPNERRAARANYKTLRELPHPQRGEIREKWQQQQSAPAAETEREATPGK